MALPGRKDGVEVSFANGKLDANFTRLSAGTVNADGLIAKTLSAPKHPPLGLKCVPDRTSQTLSELEKNANEDLLRTKDIFDKKKDQSAAPFTHALDVCGAAPALHAAANGELKKFNAAGTAPAAEGAPGAAK